MFSTLLNFVRTKTWLPFIVCIVPILIYIWFFKVIALNVNYVAFDDILILGIIPEFGKVSWPARWQMLTTLFPEHRLVFSRSILLLLYHFFGKVNLVWAMILANGCWAACAFVFYRAFQKLKISFWYFIPIIWLWFNVQAFENIFWGVSSLCNFGVLLFVLGALYSAVYHSDRLYLSLLLAVAATFTYGNGLLIFPVLGMIHLLAGRRKAFLVTLLTAVAIAGIYFMNFTPITQNLNFADPEQRKEGFFGLFGFLGSIATLAAYTSISSLLYLAVFMGMLMVAAFIYLFRKQVISLWNSLLLRKEYTNNTALFSLGIAVFVGITALALTYKRIPTDTFTGMFKGRYRMYSTLLCVALYMSFLTLSKPVVRLNMAPFIILTAIFLNLVILHSNFADAVNNRRAAIAQEFNARYNKDWLGIKMFDMNQAYFEKIRSYYHSGDPIAEGWNPSFNMDIQCDSLYKPSPVELKDNQILIRFENAVFNTEKDFSDGAYVIMRSGNHTYASPPNQYAVPLKTTVRRFLYFSKGITAGFHTATVEPGLYTIYLLVRKNGYNRIYCTGASWEEKN